MTSTNPPSKLEWEEDTDDQDNTIWYAASLYHDDGVTFWFRICQRLEDNRIVYYDNSTSEIATDGCWLTLQDAQEAMQSYNDAIAREICEESE